MGAVKTFTVQQEAPAEPIPFQIEFLPDPETNPDGEPRVEMFYAHGRTPGGATMSMVSLNRVDGRGKRVIDVSGLPGVLEKMMPSAEFERFQTLIDDPEWIVDWDTILEIFNYLVEEQSDRPTRRSRPSSRTRPGGGRTEQGVVIALQESSVQESTSSS